MPGGVDAPGMAEPEAASVAPGHVSLGMCEHHTVEQELVSR